MEIHASYRFIPVEKEQQYFSPSWKKDVSQDVPLKDYQSGTIEYTLTANTAIFVKGNDGKFCQIDGEYFIPGTTIKGCVRSVLEIMSFGHLDETRVKDNKEKFPFRDIQDQNGYMRQMSQVYCGWLTDNGQIVKWGAPVHIKYDDIIRKLTNCSFGLFRNLNTFEKYRKTSGRYLQGNFSNPKRLEGTRPYDKRLFCQFFEGGSRGTVIFSGAMQNKKSDFVLLERDERTTTLTVPDAILRAFKELYPDFRRIPFNQDKGGRAVFFTMDGNENVLTLGLSYLHKYYAANKITDAIPAGMKGNEPDLADLIFGSVKHNLKGRVQFSMARQEKAELLLAEGDTILNVLGEPRASYYPTYLQDKATWDTEGGIISGIKRYPIKPRYDIGVLELQGNDTQNYETRFGSPQGKLFESKVEGHNLIPRDATNGEINFDTITPMNPLKEGSTFSGCIHFHNLKKEELGALLSALTFHGQEEKCKHSLGQAKSHGYGSVSLAVKKITVSNKTEEKDSFLMAYEALMNQYVQSMTHNAQRQWKETPQIKELFAMAKGFSEESIVDIFSSMLLEEFGKVKGNYMRGKDDFSLFSTIMQYSNQRSSTSSNHERNQGIHQREAPKQAEAIVTYFSGALKKARLIEGKNQAPQMLDMNGKKDKFKGNGKEKILVEITKKGLRFIKAL